jgi:hypothetical protein
MFLVFAALASCAGFEGYPKDPEYDATLTALRTKYFGPNADDAYSGLTPGDANRQNVRDTIVYSRIRVYDIEFSKFQRELNGTGNSISVGSDLTALILNGLGATTGSATHKSCASGCLWRSYWCTGGH